MSSNNNNQETSFLRTCLAVQRKKIYAVILFSFIINILMLTIPLYLLQVFNRVIPSQSTDTLIFLTIIVFVSLTTIAILEFLRRMIFANIGIWLEQRLGGFILSGTIVRSVEKSKTSSAQGLRDLATIRQLFSGSSLFPILDVPWTPIFLWVLYLLHPTIGNIALIGSILLLGVGLLNELSTRNLTNRKDDASSMSKKYATSLLRNADVIEAMGMRGNIVGTWDKFHNQSIKLHQILTALRNKILFLAKFIRLMMQMVVIGVGGLLVLEHELTVGGMIAGVLLMRRAVAPMDKAIDSWKTIVKAKKAFKRIDQRLAFSPELHQNTRISQPLPSQELIIKDLFFTYSGRSKKILKGLTFKVNAGESIGISGNTATGKSTLARLLVGLASPDSGYVHFDGSDVTSWRPEEIGALIGFLPQDSELFSGTVEENIARMGAVDSDAVLAAAELAGVHDMISQFPEGYETDIGEDGSYLSGGQRQRIALARAVYDVPKLLVLDEPDANLDREGKKALANVLVEMKKKGSIIILISHQVKILRLTDRILLISKGKLKQVIDNNKAPTQEPA